MAFVAVAIVITLVLGRNSGHAAATMDTGELSSSQVAIPSVDEKKVMIANHFPFFSKCSGSGTDYCSSANCDSDYGTCS
jgi:hypothetical protein